MAISTVCRVPGKLILSGEHAVGHGCKAVAVAINRYVTTELMRKETHEVVFDLAGYGLQEKRSYTELASITQKLDMQYQKFIIKKTSIPKVYPVELLQYTFYKALLDAKLPLTQGLHFRIQTDLPIGCGLGSSAAVIISILSVCNQFYQAKWNNEKLLQLGRTAENLQHGYSSGFDLAVVLQGGCQLFQAGHTTPLKIPKMSFQVVYTGTPKANTGECVAHTSALLQDPLLKREFNEMTLEFISALKTGDHDNLLRTIKLNHQLLCQIGVVPSKIQQFIATIENHGMAGKICGAGSIHGDNAGIVWIVGELTPTIESLIKDYGYQTLTLEQEPHGTTLL